MLIKHISTHLHGPNGWGGANQAAWVKTPVSGPQFKMCLSTRRQMKEH